MTEKLTDDDLKRAEELCEHATPEPWKLWGMDIQGGSPELSESILVASTFCLNEENHPRTFDADFIVITSHEPFHRIDGFFGIGHSLPFGRRAHQTCKK